MLRILAFAAALLAVPAAAPAAPTACPQHFAGGDAPDLINQRLTTRTHELCYGGYAVLHSGVTRTPLYAAERLTRERIAAARAIQRHGTFHADPNLPGDERAELVDYARSGYDRGHMAPSADMPDSEQQAESFSLANMIPQNPESNRDLWSDIEAAVRGLARRQGGLYVVTGPVYRGDRIERLNGRVLVPTHVFKAVYDAAAGQAGAYLVPNAAGDEWTAVSIGQLQELAGIDVFPALPRSVKDVTMPLPDPEPQRRRSQVGERRQEGNR